MSYTDHEDPWLTLCERFAGRGVTLRIGNVREDMIKHLLDTVEEQDQRIRGLEDALRRQPRLPSQVVVRGPEEGE